MPDAFFANSKKRKRPQGNARSSGKYTVNKLTKTKGPQQREPKRRNDEELSGGSQSDVADLDLRASDVDPNESDKEEYANETPAEKRLRLAKVYLDTVKEDIALGSSKKKNVSWLNRLIFDLTGVIIIAEGEYDAAEIDREIISSRLKEDVVSQKL